MRTFTLILSSLSLFLIGCDKKDYSPDSSNSTGKGFALSNGKNWEGYAQIAYNPFTKSETINVKFTVLDDYGSKRQSFGINKIPVIEEMTFPLLNSSVRTDDGQVGVLLVTLSYDGDVVEDRYLVLEDSALSHVTLTEIDRQTGWYRGTFSAVFYLDPDRPKFNPANPDTIQFEQGRFEVQMRE